MFLQDGRRQKFKNVVTLRQPLLVNVTPLRMHPKIALLLHQPLMKLCYHPVPLNQTLASILSKALNMRLCPLSIGKL
jgi:hypothetical protein